MERQIGSGQLSSELSYDGKQGLSVSANLSMGNGLGLGTNLDRNGVTASTIIHGSQSGTVDQLGNYTANQNFLSEINGGDLQDEIDADIRQRDAEYDALHPPAKSAKDAANASSQRQDEEGPQGLVDLLFAGGSVLLSATAAALAGGRSSAPTAPSRSAGGGGNTNTPLTDPKLSRKEDEKDEEHIGHDNEDPSKGLTRDELADYKELQNKLRNGEELSHAEETRYAHLDDIRKIQNGANGMSNLGSGFVVRDAEAEISRVRENAGNSNAVNLFKNEKSEVTEARKQGELKNPETTKSIDTLQTQKEKAIEKIKNKYSENDPKRKSEIESIENDFANKKKEVLKKEDALQRKLKKEPQYGTKEYFEKLEKDFEKDAAKRNWKDDPKMYKFMKNQRLERFKNEDEYLKELEWYYDGRPIRSKAKPSTIGPEATEADSRG